MKKIRFTDLTELEVYNISDHGNMIVIDVLNADSNAMEAWFTDVNKLSSIMYYAGEDLIKGYAGYVHMLHYTKRMGQTISTDYTAQDASKKSGFAEEIADIFTVTLRKQTDIEVLQEGQILQDAAIMDIAFEIGG